MEIKITTSDKLTITITGSTTEAIQVMQSMLYPIQHAVVSEIIPDTHQIEEKTQYVGLKKRLILDACESCGAYIEYPERCRFCKNCVQAGKRKTEASKNYQKEYYSRVRINELLQKGITVEQIRTLEY